MLGTEFYEREHSKPLFKKYNFLTVHNLYKYHCLLEMFKIVKLRTPMPVYELFSRSTIRDDKLISLNPSTLFDYQSSDLWIKLYTRYPIVARRAWPTGCIGRVRRASKGILHTMDKVSQV